MAWLVPGIGILLAVGAIGYFTVRRIRRPPTDSGPQLDAAERSRLDEDMARYDI